jgi:membrane protein required for colicin V production
LTGIDFLIGTILLVSILIGVTRGLVREVVALVFWIAAIWAAWMFGPLVEPYLGGLLTGPNVRTWVGRLVVLVIVLCIGALVGFVMGLLARGSGLGWLDRTTGAMFGLVRGMVLLGALVIGGEVLHLNQESWWHRSTLIPYCETVGDWLRALVREKGEPWARLERLTGVKIR